MGRALDDRTGAIKYGQDQLTASPGVKLRMAPAMPYHPHKDRPLDDYLRALGRGIIGLPGRLYHYVQRTLERLTD